MQLIRVSEASTSHPTRSADQAPQSENVQKDSFTTHSTSWAGKGDLAFRPTR